METGMMHMYMYFITLQVNYLIDEGEKGANTIISMLHHFFSTHSLGDCTSTPTALVKTKIVTRCSIWRGECCLASMTTSHCLFFDSTPHKIFPRLSRFGILKQAYRRKKIECLDDIVDAQLIGGTVVV